MMTPVEMDPQTAFVLHFFPTLRTLERALVCPVYISDMHFQVELVPEPSSTHRAWHDLNDARKPTC
ncbi:hypothetical protein C0J52_03561 [Blattella germanica]|nr:hypothetical protein C0J52_03561 [Blattella germanica]